MAIKVIIRRKFKDGHEKEASRMLIQARNNAMQEKGYISSETLSNSNDPSEIVVLSTWQKHEDWTRYENSSPRQELERSFSEMMDGRTQTIAYEMGLQN